MTEPRADLVPDAAEEAAGLPPGNDDNEVWHDLCRCESVISIRY